MMVPRRDVRIITYGRYKQEMIADEKNKDGSEKYRTVELSEMLKNYKLENGKRKNYSIDYVPKIDCFEKKEFSLHPYVVGALIGDGGLTGGSVLLSSVDKELLDRFDSFLPDGYSLKYKERCTYFVSGHEGDNAKVGSLVRKELDRLGLFGKKSIDKFIPKDYLYGSYEQRLWLLRGLWIQTDLLQNLIVHTLQFQNILQMMYANLFILLEVMQVKTNVKPDIRKMVSINNAMIILRLSYNLPLAWIVYFL